MVLLNDVNSNTFFSCKSHNLNMVRESTEFCEQILQLDVKWKLVLSKQ